MKSVVVVIVNWNSWSLLERCLEGLAAQTVTDFSIVIVDNGSVEPMPARLLAAYPDTTVVLSTANLGFAAANNLAIFECADGAEWVALLNADAFPEPGWLEALLRGASSHPEFDAFGSKLLMAASPDILDGAGDVYHMSGRVWRNGRGRPAVSIADRMGEVFSPCAAAALYRRTAFVAVGGFDNDYFCYVEDIDLGFRLRLAGYRCLYVPESVVHHVGSGATGGQHSDFAVYFGHRNLVWTFVKNVPGWLFWVLLPLHLTLNIASMFWFLLRGQGKVIMRAKRDAIAGLPVAWEKRRHIQGTRRVPVREIWRMLDKRLLP